MAAHSPQAARRASVAPGVSGLFVTFEGIDRSGKTTQAKLLADALGQRALAVREPGATRVGERVRELLKDPGVVMAPRTEALLFAAARAELVAGVIRPALEEGRIVISDRFTDSSLAYQGAARGLGIDEVARVNDWGTGGLTPDLTILLWLDTRSALKRGGDEDRFAGEGIDLQERVAAGYEELEAAEPNRWRRVAADRPPEDVHADVLAVVETTVGVSA